MKKIALYLSLLFIVSACDIMDKSPLDIISEDVVWNDEALINAYIDGVYSEMSFLVRDGFGHEWVDPTSSLSDEGRQGRDWHDLYTKWKGGYMNKEGGLIELWNYGTIRNTNEFLEKIEPSTAVTGAKKEELKARIRFARALVYFNMVKRYGGIPVITKPQDVNSPLEELMVPRDKEVDVYDFIINEMDDIADALPPTLGSGELGYPTRYAALALKSRAALFAGSIATWGKVEIDGLVGIPQSEAKRFWQAAYDASKAIIDSKVYSLYNQLPDDKEENFRQLFLDENNSEVIFSKQLTGEKVSSNYDLFMSPFQFCPGWGGANTSVYLEMVESFENIDGSPGTFDRVKAASQPWDLREFFAGKDPRFFATIYFEGDIWKGEAIENWGGVITEDGSRITSGSYNGITAQGRSYTCAGFAGGQITGFNVKKYLDDKLIPVNENKTSVDFIVFRLGEIYLNLAEVAFELGKTDEALSAVNTVRERAGIARLKEITRDKIRNERKVELAFENQRWWDLKRWRIAVDAISRTFTGIYTFYDYKTKKFVIEMNDNADGGVPAQFKEEHYYFPITPGRISNNPKLAPENPGY